jgi:CDP-diacylglycerol--glycerol-3-phosphate 3-phosphatidyltransferase
MRPRDSTRETPKERRTLTQWGRHLTRGIVGPIADRLAKWGVSPNLLTAAGLLANILAALLLARGERIWAGIVLIILGPLDNLDGALARRLNQTSKVGAFLDSNFDRLSEVALYLGMLWFYQGQAATAEVILIYLTITGSILVSYARARAEALGAECEIGLMTRMERFLILLAGLFTGYVVVALTLLAVLTYVTVMQRIWHTRRILEKESRQHNHTKG